MGSGCLKGDVKQTITDIFIYRPPEKSYASTDKADAVPESTTEVTPFKKAREGEPVKNAKEREPVKEPLLQLPAQDLLDSELSSEEDFAGHRSEEVGEAFERGLDSIPSFFGEILCELENYCKELGGLHHFRRRPYIERKVNKRDFSTAYTDYEFIYLTVLGFAQLHLHQEEIISRNNGDTFTRNPGVQMLERVCGITMHARQEGSNHLLRTAPAILVEAFQLAKSAPNGTLHFFRNAFDRTGGPCLEGRVGCLMKYIESQRAAADPASSSVPPWEEVALRPLPSGAAPRDIVGEHLRVFMAECTWAWCCERKIAFELASQIRLTNEHAEEFSKLYNAATFRQAMVARGTASEFCMKQWESATKGGQFLPYQPDVSDKIEQAFQREAPSVEVKLGPKAWTYVIDFSAMVQRNKMTGQERPIRSVDVPPEQRKGRLTLMELDDAIEYFVDLATLPAAATEPLGAKPEVCVEIARSGDDLAK